MYFIVKNFRCCKHYFMRQRLCIVFFLFSHSFLYFMFGINIDTYQYHKILFISIKYWYIAHHYFLFLHCPLPLFWPFKSVFSPHNMEKSSGNTWQSSTVSIEMFSIAHLITVSLLCSRLLVTSCDCSLIDIPEPTWKSFFWRIMKWLRWVRCWLHNNLSEN